MATHPPASFLLGPIAVAHDARPQATRGAELRDLLEQRRPRHEEERQSRREVIHLQSTINGSLDRMERRIAELSEQLQAIDDKGDERHEQNIRRLADLEAGGRWSGGQGRPRSGGR